MKPVNSDCEHPWPKLTDEELKQWVHDDPRATLLNRDDQPIATGQATVYLRQKVGTFFLQKALQGTWDTIRQTATTLKTSEATYRNLKVDLEPCQEGSGRAHFHFEFSD